MYRLGEVGADLCSWGWCRLNCSCSRSALYLCLSGWCRLNCSGFNRSALVCLVSLFVSTEHGSQLILIFFLCSIDLQPVQYVVCVYTADISQAGTDANVFITVYGSNGDTGRRPLTKKFVNLFERGQKDDFKFEALELGQLTRLRIEHDNKGFGAGWMLERVEVENLATQQTTCFPCNQWLDKKKGDGLICRDLTPLPA